jgi:hypothetical protein
MSNGEIKGEIVSKISEIENLYSIKLKFIEILEGRIEESINSKKNDGFFTLVKSSEREKYLHFTNVEILTTSPQLCSIKKFNYSNLKNFIKTSNKEMRLLIPMSKLVNTMFKSFPNKTNFNYEGDYQKRAISMLNKGRVDTFSFQTLLKIILYTVVTYSQRKPF